MLEGQGKVLWSYSSFTRILFDAAIGVAALRSYVDNQKILYRERIPTYMYVMIVLFFVWYIFQFFNFYSVGIFAVFGGMKVYIIPFVTFFIFLSNPVNWDNEVLKKGRNLALFFIFFETILSFYQMSMKEASVTGMSPYYAVLMSDKFTGPNFRPFGTSFRAGAIGYYLFFMSGFLFFPKLEKRKAQILNILAVGAVFYVHFLCQTRSTILKHVIFYFIGFLWVIVPQENRARVIKRYVIPLGVLGFISSFFLDLNQLLDSDLGNATMRFMTLFEGNIGRDRLSFTDGLGILFDKMMTHPMGLGPGRTGAAMGLGYQEILKDPVYGIASSATFDNLYITLSVDFGLGMLFLAFIYLWAPLILLKNGWVSFTKKNIKATKLLFMCSGLCLSLSIMNWGAVGLPYIPANFCFWMYLGMGFTALYEKNHEEEVKKILADDYKVKTFEPANDSTEEALT